MLKDYYNEIIPPWDSRYGKLGHIWKKYNWNNIIKGKGPGRKFYAPKELVINDIITHRGNRILQNPETDDNYISTNSLDNLLIQSCDLTKQEYSDLVIYHINSKLNRPRCPICGNPIRFSEKMNTCYQQTCSQRCAATYNHQNSELMRLHSIENFSRIDVHVKAEFKQLLSRGPLDENVVIYVVLTETTPKFGVSRDLNMRINCSRMSISYKEVLFQEVTTRYKAACIEAQLKLDNYGSEWISTDEVEYYESRIMDLLNKPTTNPFE